MRRLAPFAALLALAAAPVPAGDADARARLAELNRREAALAERMGANRSALVRLLAALESVRRDPPPALLVRPERARDAARAAILLKAITPELQRRARSFAGEAEALKRVRREAAAANAALFAAESADADARRPAPRPRPGDLIPAPSAPEPAVSGAGPLRLAPPLPKAPVLRFGDALPEGGRSRGWTWTATAGATVRAPADAVVEHAGPIRGRGLVAVLRLEGGWRVVVAGLRRVDAGRGGVVRAGDELGRAAGGELLLELRRGTEPVDPGAALGAR